MAEDAEEGPKVGKITQFFTVLAVASSFSVFGSFVSSTSHLNGAGLKPCDHGCTFIRYFGSKELPATAPRNFNYTNLLNASGGMPNFVTITNGDRKVVFAEQQVDIPQVYQYLALGCNIFTIPMLCQGQQVVGYESGMSPISDLGNQSCDNTSMRLRAKNHLSDAPSKIIYLYCLGMWAMLLCIHELAVMNGCSAKITTSIGLMALYPEVAAVASSFLWGIGATEVFVSTDGIHQGCYYEMPVLAALFVTVTPALLLKKCWDDLFLNGAALLHGDFLRSTTYHVPWPIARKALPTMPTFPIIPSHVVGDIPRTSVHMHETPNMGHYMMLLGAKQGQRLATGGIVVCFGAYPLTAKAMGLAQQGVREWKLSQPYSVNMAVSAVMIVVIFGSPVYSLYKGVPTVQRRFHQLKFLLARLRVRHESDVQVKEPTELAASRFLAFVAFIGIFNVVIPTWNAIWYCPPLLMALYDTEEPNAERAREWGLSGCYFAWMLTACYRSYDTPWEYLQQAIQIKCGNLPYLGLTDILVVDAMYPHLGLGVEAMAVIEILRMLAQQSQTVAVLDGFTLVNAILISVDEQDEVKQVVHATPLIARSVRQPRRHMKKTKVHPLSMPLLAQSSLENISQYAPVAARSVKVKMQSSGYEVLVPASKLLLNFPPPTAVISQDDRESEAAPSVAPSAGLATSRWRDWVEKTKLEILHETTGKTDGGKQTLRSQYTALLTKV